MTFDLAIIGGGPAGYTAAERAAAGGLHVILFEKTALGGVCLNEGCIPTKTMLYSAKLYHNTQTSAKYGVFSENTSFDYEKIVARKNKIIRKLNAGIRTKMTSHNVVVVTGEAQVSSYSETEITIQCGEEKYQTKNLLLCTGSQVAVPPIKGVDTTPYWTSKEALETKKVPKSLVIIGGGVIGMEFAGLFSTFGCQVTVIEMAEEILPSVDMEIAAMLRAEYAKQGVTFHLSSKVLELQPNTVFFADSEGEKCIDTEQILLCVGRKPSLNGFEMLPLEKFRNGIKVDETMRTSIKNVYAAGDITGFSLLAHTAVREAEVAVNNILGMADEMSYKAVPAVVYTNPEVAGVGKTQAELDQKGISCHVKQLPMTFSGRFVAENETGNGICKIIVTSEEKVVGVHLIGNPASELIATAALAVETEMSVAQFKKLIFPHPSVGEIIKETLFE